METVQIVIETITGNIFYMILAVALIILIGYGLVKKLFKLVIVMLICLSIYIGYIYWTEGSEGVQDTLNKVQKGIKEAQEDFEKGLNNMKDTKPK